MEKQTRKVKHTYIIMVDDTSYVSLQTTEKEAGYALAYFKRLYTTKKVKMIKAPEKTYNTLSDYINEKESNDKEM